MLGAQISSAQVRYSTLNYPGTGSTGLSGVRGIGGQDVYITGGFQPASQKPPKEGVLYKGPLHGGGTWAIFNYPTSPGVSVNTTVLYGPDDPSGLPPNNVRVVGSYTKSETGAMNHGLLYDGPDDGSGTNWQTLDFPETGVLNTIAHSTMGGLVVGNYDKGTGGRAFVYDINANANPWVPLIKPGALSITAYGIWYNGGTQYTIAGGYSDANLNGIDHGYLVNWDSATQKASDWTSYDYQNRNTGVAISHFNGITGDNHGGFYLTGDWVGAIAPNAGAFLAHVRRTPNRLFHKANWTPIAYPSASTTSGDTVFENNVIGIFSPGISPAPVSSFVATVQGHR
jgi:hypothetical protein